MKDGFMICFNVALMIPGWAAGANTVGQSGKEVPQGSRMLGLGGVFLFYPAVLL